MTAGLPEGVVIRNWRPARSRARKKLPVVSGESAARPGSRNSCLPFPGSLSSALSAVSYRDGTGGPRFIVGRFRRSSLRNGSASFPSLASSSRRRASSASHSAAGSSPEGSQETRRITVLPCSSGTSMTPGRKRSSCQSKPRSRSSVYSKRLYQTGRGEETGRQAGPDGEGRHPRVGFDRETVCDPFRPAADMRGFPGQVRDTPGTPERVSGGGVRPREIGPDHTGREGCRCRGPASRFFAGKFHPPGR